MPAAFTRAECGKTLEHL